MSFQGTKEDKEVDLEVGWKVLEVDTVRKQSSWNPDFSGRTSTLHHLSTCLQKRRLRWSPGFFNYLTSNGLIICLNLYTETARSIGRKKPLVQRGDFPTLIKTWNLHISFWPIPAKIWGRVLNVPIFQLSALHCNMEIGKYCFAAVDIIPAQCGGIESS